ncbi:MAG TPA: isoprenylcysteine carboxylmethyltransferase family protein [bacterium]|nr:isoprenylcysteine carboxylmethyltransferase family protein [bacterium]
MKSHRDLLPRVTGAVFFTAYAAYIAVLQRNEIIQAPGPIAIEPLVRRGFVVLIFLLMASSYVLRRPARVRATGFRERVFPFVCAVLPIALNESSALFAPFAGLPSLVTERLADGLLFLGNALSVWGLIYLRRAFSIMAEVRDLVSRGPYRFVRHPIYEGQILATTALWLLSPSWGSTLLLLVFIAAQLARASIEESKLEASLPGYKRYRERTGAYLPRLVGKHPTP